MTLNPLADSKLADAIAHQEGFYVAGSLPQRNNNPGDLRHGNAEVHPDNQPDAVGSFATPELGWAALNRQLRIDASRNWTVAQLIESYAPSGPPDFNNTDAYLAFVTNFVGCDPDTLVAALLPA
jgi:hypothetical protein